MDKERSLLFLSAPRTATTTARGERGPREFARISAGELGECIQSRAGCFRLLLDEAAPRRVRRDEPVLGIALERRSTLG